jgi:hypothetical protein
MRTSRIFCYFNSFQTLKKFRIISLPGILRSRSSGVGTEAGLFFFNTCSSPRTFAKEVSWLAPQRGSETTWVEVYHTSVKIKESLYK